MIAIKLCSEMAYSRVKEDRSPRTYLCAPCSCSSSIASAVETCVAGSWVNVVIVDFATLAGFSAAMTVIGVLNRVIWLVSGKEEMVESLPNPAIDGPRDSALPPEVPDAAPPKTGNHTWKIT